MKNILLFVVGLIGFTSISQATTLDAFDESRNIKTFTATLHSVPFLAFTVDENQYDMSLAEQRAEDICRYFNFGKHAGDLETELVSLEEIQESMNILSKDLINPYTINSEGLLERVRIFTTDRGARSTALIPFIGLIQHFNSQSPYFFSQLSCEVK